MYPPPPGKKAMGRADINYTPIPPSLVHLSRGNSCLNISKHFLYAGIISRMAEVKSIYVVFTSLLSM